MTSALLTSIQLGNCLLPNRMVMAPLTRMRATHQIPTPLMATYYAQRASAGLIISEASPISAQGVGYPQTPGIYTQQQIAGWQAVTAAVHEQGGRIFCQLWHVGRISHPDFHNGELPVAPSAIEAKGNAVTPKGFKPFVTPRALSLDEMPGIVEQYRQAALNAMAAGFDGVEIHAANGYLIDEFIQSKTNRRTDIYGGSLENRFRFLHEILDAVCTVYPAHRVGVRFSPNGAFNDMGSADYRETFLYGADRLNAFALGYLHVMDGLAFGFHELGEPMTLAEFREVFKDGGGWERFRGMFPDSDGTLRFSRVGLDRDVTQAVLYAGQQFDWNVGSGGYRLFSKVDGAWTERARVGTWIS